MWVNQSARVFVDSRSLVEEPQSLPLFHIKIFPRKLCFQNIVKSFVMGMAHGRKKMVLHVIAKVEMKKFPNGVVGNSEGVDQGVVVFSERGEIVIGGNIGKRNIVLYQKRNHINPNPGAGTGGPKENPVKGEGRNQLQGDTCMI